MILPVDPMAWGLSRHQFWTQHDALLSVSEDGELAFWKPEECVLSKPEQEKEEGPEGNGWRCTGRVRTARKGIVKASCSSAKKTALRE